MNPLFNAVIYAALHKRVKCGYCASLDHHRRIGRGRYLCRDCRREFTADTGKR